MIGFKKAAITSTILALSTAAMAAMAAMAAKPIYVKYIEDTVTENNQIYSLYTVECSNGKIANMSAWNNHKKWCVGKGHKNMCNKIQINTAKAACR